MANEPPINAPIMSLGDDVLTLKKVDDGGGDDAKTLIRLSDSDVALESVGDRTPEQVALEAFVGRTISDRYAIHELIGSGGMGAVYRGEQVHLRRRCAIKILLPEAAKKPELVLRFEREAIAGAHVVHPNVVGAVDFGKLPDGACFLVQEFVEGTPLEDLMKYGPLAVEKSLGYARQIAQALAAVHEKGILHRDVKPRNILVDTQGQIKLLDFGLAKVNVELLSAESRNAKPAPALTSQGVVMGTLNYMAPEAVKGMDAVDIRSDLYALGVIMFEMFTGKRPFDEKDPVLLFKRLRTEAAPAFKEKAPDVNVPANVEAIVAKLLERDPVNRYATANELITVIDAAMPEAKATVTPIAAKPAEEAKPAEIAKETPKESAAAPAKKKPAGPNPKLILAGAGALAFLILIVVVLVFGGSPEKDKSADAANAGANSAVAEPSKPPVNVVVEIDGIDAAGWREKMRKAIPKKEWLQAARAFLALTKLDPALVTGNEMRTEVIATVAGIGFETSLPESDQVFEALTNDLGSGGLDILFQVMRTRGGSKAAVKATEILTRPGVLDRATPALRIAYELRKTPCHDKRKLFARAAEEGDARALDELIITQQANCPSRKDPCCYREDPEMKDTISKLRARITP